MQHITDNTTHYRQHITEMHYKYRQLNTLQTTQHIAEMRCNYTIVDFSNVMSHKPWQQKVYPDVFITFVFSGNTDFVVI